MYSKRRFGSSTSKSRTTTLFSAAIPMTEIISLIGDGVDHDKAPKDICKQISKPDHHTARNLYEHI